MFICVDYKKKYTKTHKRQLKANEKTIWERKFVYLFQHTIIMFINVS